MEGTYPSDVIAVADPPWVAVAVIVPGVADWDPRAHTAIKIRLEPEPTVCDQESVALVVVVPALEGPTASQETTPEPPDVDCAAPSVSAAAPAAESEPVAVPEADREIEAAPVPGADVDPPAPSVREAAAVVGPTVEPDAPRVREAVEETDACPEPDAPKVREAVAEAALIVPAVADPEAPRVSDAEPEVGCGGVSNAYGTPSVSYAVAYPAVPTNAVAYGTPSVSKSISAYCPAYPLRYRALSVSSDKTNGIPVTVSSINSSPDSNSRWLPSSSSQKPKPKSAMATRPPWTRSWTYPTEQTPRSKRPRWPTSPAKSWSQ